MGSVIITIIRDDRKFEKQQSRQTEVLSNVASQLYRFQKTVDGKCKKKKILQEVDVESA